MIDQKVGFPPRLSAFYSPQIGLVQLEQFYGSINIEYLSLSEHLSILEERESSARIRLKELKDLREIVDKLENGLHDRTLKMEAMRVKLELCKKVLDFYSWSMPVQFPEGYYETNVEENMGGHIPFGYKARKALKAISDKGEG